ncbi:hypothetical protein [Qipengyuania sp. NPDC077563]|uniref:hypothetical protein n=1 Tax=Qipengyuania sp. NPDC077563 TaxID=3364497 RepID=UPI003850CF92
MLQLLADPRSGLFFYDITSNGPVGLFANRNHAAILLACCSVIVIYLYRELRLKIRPALPYLAAFFALCILTNPSPAGLLALGMAAVICAVLQFSTKVRSRRPEREAKRLLRDRKIYAKLRLLAAEGEQRHARFDEPIEPLSVYYGKQSRPASWELSPFPMGKQANGRPMPQWEDLSQWMKVNVAVIVGFEWELLTFNINLHPELETELTRQGNVRKKLAERVRKHVGRSIGFRREYYSVLEGHAKLTGAKTHLNMHGTIAIRAGDSVKILMAALARAAGHDIGKRKRIPRAVHSQWFTVIRAAYANYLFKFARRRDPRLDERRLVMSQEMTQAAKMFWNDVARPELS